MFKKIAKVVFYPITFTVKSCKLSKEFNKAHPNFKAKDVKMLSAEDKALFDKNGRYALLAILSWISVIAIPMVIVHKATPKTVVEEVEVAKYEGLNDSQTTMLDNAILELVNGEATLDSVSTEFSIHEDGSGASCIIGYKLDDGRGIITTKMGIVQMNPELTEITNTQVGDYKKDISVSLESKLKTNAKDLIRQSLKAPSTAKFPSLLDNGWTFFIDENNNVIVKTYVDSQNSFGAMVRTHFSLYADLDNDIISIAETY